MRNIIREESRWFQCTKQLEELKKEDFDKYIALYSIGCYIGYIQEGVPEYSHDTEKENDIFYYW